MADYVGWDAALISAAAGSSAGGASGHPAPRRLVGAAPRGLVSPTTSPRRSRPSVNDIRELNVPAGQSYFVEGRWDPVADFGRFGAGPTYMAGVEHLESGPSIDPDDGHRLEGSTLHGLGGYLGEDTTTRYNAERLLVGQTDGLIRGEDEGLGDGLRREVPDEW